MSPTIDKNRKVEKLTQARVKETLPEYFSEDNPNLITFLEKYYDFLDSDGRYSFNSSIQEIISARDTQENSSKLLNEVIKEIGDGLQSASFFHQPRLMAKLLGAFYRSKGTLVSAEGFFRGFFNEPLEVEYPKDQIFIVGESNIGFEDRKFIQNNELYQIFSILLKTGISTTDYETLYKKFVHPAGWYFQGEVVTTNEINLNVSHLENVDGLRPVVDSATTKVFGPELFITPVLPFAEHTLVFDSDNIGAGQIRATLTSTIEAFQNLTPNELEKFYANAIELITPNSFTFDDSGNHYVNLGFSSADSTDLDVPRPDFSLEFETMDNDMFKRYLSDSGI